MNSIHHLKELQNIDDNLSEIRSYLGDLPVKVEELKSKEAMLIEELDNGKDCLKHIEVELNKIEVVTDYKHLQIREVTDSGGYHRRVLTPDEDVSSEVSAIQLPSQS